MQAGLLPAILLLLPVLVSGCCRQAMLDSLGRAEGWCILKGAAVCSLQPRGQLLSESPLLGAPACFPFSCLGHWGFQNAQ